MPEDQLLERENDKDIPYYVHGLAADAFDLTIRHVRLDDKANNHAKVEIVFFQDKGNHKREVVTAVRMQLHELLALADMITHKSNAFLGGDSKRPGA